MVDVSGKEVSARSATASGRVQLSPAAVAALRDGTVPKGDALAVARIAAIQGAKRTPDLIPLCHPIGLHAVVVDLTVDDDGVQIGHGQNRRPDRRRDGGADRGRGRRPWRLIDMIKAVDPAAVITDVRSRRRPAARPASGGGRDPRPGHHGLQPRLGRHLRRQVRPGAGRAAARGRLRDRRARR